MRRDPSRLRFTIVLPAAFLMGCREELGTERYVTAEVVGTLKWGGRPIQQGWVEFIPIEGTVGKLRSAPIHNGSFVADRVAVGWNQVGLVNALDRDLSQQFHPLGTPIRRKIPAQTSELNIDLLDEVMKLRTARTR